MYDSNSKGISYSAGFFILIRKESQQRMRQSRLIEEKQGLEIKLVEEKNQFETLFEVTNAGIALVNLDGRLLRVNKSLCELLGYSVEDMLSMNFYYLMASMGRN